MSHYFVDDPNLEDDFRDFPYFYRELAFQFTSNSGVFSPGHVDVGTDLLIKSLPPLQGSLLDLACGYGPIGIVLGKAYDLSVTMADVNPRALCCAEINCKSNEVKATILSSDCFENIPDKFDAITLNPPIHAGKDVVYRMFEETPTHLNPGGAFYTVLLEKHGAKSARRKLEELFGNCEALYHKKGAYVFCCKN